MALCTPTTIMPSLASSFHIFQKLQHLYRFTVLYKCTVLMKWKKNLTIWKISEWDFKKFIQNFTSFASDFENFFKFLKSQNWYAVRWNNIAILKYALRLHTIDSSKTLPSPYHCYQILTISPIRQTSHWWLIQNNFKNSWYKYLLILQWA